MGSKETAPGSQCKILSISWETQWEREKILKMELNSYFKRQKQPI